MKQLINLFGWLFTGCPLYFGGISAGMAVGIGVSAAGAVASGVMGSNATKGAANTSSNASQLAMGANAAAAAESYRKRLEAVAEANGITVQAFLQANPQLIQGYQQASDILRQTYGGDAIAATQATGTNPQQLAQWQGQVTRGTQALQQSQSELDSIKGQLQGLQWDGTPQTAMRIKQLQDAYNAAEVKTKGLQTQVTAAQQQLQGATPYKAGQAAQEAVVGRAPQALMTGAAKSDALIKSGLGESLGYIDKGMTDATGALTTGLNQSVGDVNRMSKAALGYQQPFFNAGKVGTNNLVRMMTAGNKFQATDPAYNFRLQEGLKGSEQSAAARGSQLSGATLKALSRYGQESASQEFQNTFNRNQSLSGIGQNAANVMSGIRTGQGQQLSGLHTGYGKDMGGLAQWGAGQKSGLATGAATNRANIYGTLGNNLSSLYSGAGDKQAALAQGLGSELSNRTLNQADILSGRALGSADVFANTYGNAGRENAQMINTQGQQQAAYQLQGGQNNQNMIAGIANPLMQGMMLSGGWGNTQWNGNRMGRNSNKYGAGGSNVNWGSGW